MTNKEAIKIAKSTNPLMRGSSTISGEYVEKIIEALEKQIPKKPKIVRDMDCCPICGREDGGCTESWHRPYCCNCGQALDWSDYDY